MKSVRQDSHQIFLDLHLSFPIECGKERGTLSSVSISKRWGVFILFSFSLLANGVYCLYISNKYHD
jgi:hypothetical protein